jgi:hypothetical protein
MSVHSQLVNSSVVHNTVVKEAIRDRLTFAIGRTFGGGRLAFRGVGEAAECVIRHGCKKVTPRGIILALHSALAAIPGGHSASDKW